MKIKRIIGVLCFVFSYSILLLFSTNCSFSSGTSTNSDPKPDMGPIDPENPHEDSDDRSDSGYTPPDTPQWTRFPDNLVINPSKFRMPVTNELGFNTADPCVLYDEKSKKWHAYFSSEFVSLDVQVIRHATSKDGAKWTVSDQVALELGSAGSWDSKSVETCSAVSVETSPGVFRYFLFYSGTNTLNGNDSDAYKMGLAVSDNPDVYTRISPSESPLGVSGLLFDQTQAFANPAVVSGLVTDPTVVVRGNKFEMWYFCAGANSSGSYIDGGVCRSTSADAINWVHTGSQYSLFNELSVGVLPQQPTVIFNSAKNYYEMWLVIDDPAYITYGVPGLAVGGYYHATSTDGMTWTYSSKTSFDFTWDRNLVSENNGLATGPEVHLRNGIYYLFYPSFTNQDIPATGYFPFTWGLNLATKR